MKLGQLAFSQSQQRLVNLLTKISFRETFRNLKFQLQHPNRSNYISLQSYAFNLNDTKQSGM